MVIPYHPAVAQHYEAIIAQAVETLRKSSLFPCQLLLIWVRSFAVNRSLQLSRASTTLPPLVLSLGPWF